MIRARPSQKWARPRTWQHVRGLGLGVKGLGLGFRGLRARGLGLRVFGFTA